MVCSCSCVFNRCVLSLAALQIDEKRWTFYRRYLNYVLYLFTLKLAYCIFVEMKMLKLMLKSTTKRDGIKTWLIVTVCCAPLHVPLPCCLNCACNFNFLPNS